MNTISPVWSAIGKLRLWSEATDAERQLSIRGEGDPPEILHLVVFFEKLDSVGAEALHCGDLCDHSCRRLSATIIPHNYSRANQQLNFQLDSGPVSVQVGCFDPV